MSVFSAKLGLGTAQKALERLAASLTNMRPAFLQIGEELLESTQRRFVDERSPDGAPWTALSPRYLASKAKTRSRFPKGVLKRSGQMAEGLFYEATANSLTTGSPEPYAAIHQFGGTTGKGGQMPARPFLGISEGDELAIKSIVEEHLGAD